MQFVEQRTGHGRSRARAGISAIDFAVCLPILMLLVFGTIEASNLVFLRQSLHVAAYEGLKETVRRGGSPEEGRQRAARVLRSRDVHAFRIEFPDGDPTQSHRGDVVAIKVSAETIPNSPLVGNLITNRFVSAQAVMVKE